MKNELKKFLTLGAALAGSALMVSCDGDDGAPGQDGAQGTPGTTTTVADKTVRAPSATEFALANLKMTIETDNTSFITPGTEIEIDIDSILGDSSTLFGDIHQSSNGGISSADTRITGVTTQSTSVATGAVGPDFGFDLVEYEPTDSRILASTATGSFNVINNDSADGTDNNFDKRVFSDLTFTVLDSSLYTLIGRFSGEATVERVVDEDLIFEGNGTNVIPAGNLTSVPTGVATVEANSDSQNVTLIVAGVDVYTLSNDEILLRMTSGEFCIVNVADLTVGGTGVGAGNQSGTTVSFPAGYILPVSVAAPNSPQAGPLATAGAPICYADTTVVFDTVTDAITGTFRLDCDPSTGSSEPDINQNQGNQ